jgi:hypothetical protein
LDQLVIERGGYVARGDSPEDIVRTLEQAYADWAADRLPTSKLPAIGVQQAVNRILDEVSRWHK